MKSLLTVNANTYMGDIKYDQLGVPEYLDDQNPIHVYDDLGVRLVLGGVGDDDISDIHCPDVCVEKIPDGWRIFINHHGNTQYVVELLPDRTVVIKDIGNETVSEIEH